MGGAGVDREAVERRVRSVDRMMFVHRGGVELADVDDQGNVEVRYTGMCTGCTYRPVCSEVTVRPALLAIEGVVSVKIQGGRIDEGNQARLVEDLERWRRENDQG
ncbi:NifU family protein [Streptosporangium sp. 'caverna']|uniref:NifU family protein n=1 Tax=Streptosporangium sp. 'caverna' TaxID=2202249 RepID=UPI000D7D9FBB|nr:NifU family protein [Streptosporangium sp. 'caverna']AWS40214.1 NifU family protein [Streptosporangium sp. 'caverna']